MNDDQELILRHGVWEAAVAAYGASLRGVTKDGQPVATGYQGKEQKQGGQGDVLIPFPGRVAGGTYAWDGTYHQLPQTDKDGPNAIHGFVRTLVWEVAEQSESLVRFTLDFLGAHGYPFPLGLELTYSLDDTGLTCRFVVTNTGMDAAPVAVGFHPYFTVGSERVDGDRLTLPFDSVLEMKQFIPTGTIFSVAEAGLDYRTPTAIGSTVFNHCFLAPQRDAQGRANVTLASADAEVTVWMDEAFDYVVLYTGENMPAPYRRRSLAIEPMTCGSDAFNHPEWGLKRLEPGESFTGAWGVTKK
ncbi:aldose epimerase [Armatimonas rosea]|uniref:Aldose 1-epimerase n=1 Tax=Armatimonas rosea TaxID=685828 RepID=A0A7W9SRQ1_ARMRO|nr:aldose epimerase [Armatimonas rosea]MBB6050964.1 aldose 1-epimerase [Armatimonas rosea]